MHYLNLSTIILPLMMNRNTSIIPASVTLEFHTQVSMSRVSDPEGAWSHLLGKQIANVQQQNYTETNI